MEPHENQDTVYDADDVAYPEPGVTHSTECEHDWRYVDSDPQSNLISVACAKCWSGASIDATAMTIKDGKLVPRTLNESL